VFRRFTGPDRGLIGLILLAVFCAGPFAAAGEKIPPPFEPNPEAEGAPELHGETWVEEGAEHAIRLQQVNDEERQAYIQRVTGLPTDPFASRPGMPPQYLSFLLEVENRTDGSLDLNPLNFWLQSNKKKIKTPIGLADLSFNYHVAGAELPQAYENVESALLSQPVVIGAGRARHGLLIYRAVDPKAKRFTVEVQLTMPDGDVVRFVAPYRRAKDAK
jgi:hypothetical protein